MEDRAIAKIGHWQLEKKSELELIDLYIENMFPGKDYQMLLLVFEIETNNGEISCKYKGIDIEKVGKDTESYRKYAYRKGTSGRAGDVTISTKISDIKKLKNIKEVQFQKLVERPDYESEGKIFKSVQEEYNSQYIEIEETIKDRITNTPKNEKISLGISLVVDKGSRRMYLNDFNVIRKIIEEEYLSSKITQNKKESQTNNNRCSISNEIEEEIYGFAAPFKYSSPDKPGFISGFFNKKKFWRNYPVSSKEALALEYGKKFIKQHLTGYFYGYEYLFVPHPVIKTDLKSLERIIGLLQTALMEEIQNRRDKEKKRRAEDRVHKLIAQQDNYFYIDMLFFTEDKKTEAISINIMLEEILPSRFRQLFIDAPALINKNPLFKEAFTIKKEKHDLIFSFQIVKIFFDDKFLDIVQCIFLGKPVSKSFLYEKIMYLIRKNYNDAKTQEKWVEPAIWSVKKAIMLIAYLQKLNTIPNNKNYKYMNTETIEKKSGRFDLAGFNDFVKENSGFLDSDIKVGIFAVGILVRFLFDIQQASLGNTPFGNKLRGYKLNPELLMQVYTEALDKIQKYQKNFYVYTDLREVINQYFIIKLYEIKSLNNNEISFYFVSGLELGRRFKHEKEAIN